MARVTVEDCLTVVKNRFELSVLAGFRATQIAKGSVSDVNKNNDKSTVVALREIADNHHDVSHLREVYIHSLRRSVTSNDLLEEETSFVTTEAVNPQAVSESPVSMPADEDDDAEDLISVENYDFEDDE